MVVNLAAGAANGFKRNRIDRTFLIPVPKTENSLHTESGEGENGSLVGGGYKYQPELHETNAELVLRVPTDNRERNLRESGQKMRRHRRDARDVIAVFNGGTGKKIPADKGWAFE